MYLLLVPYGSRLPATPTSGAATVAAMNAYNPLPVPSNMTPSLPAYRMVNQQVLPGATSTSVQPPVGLLPQHLTASQYHLLQQQQQVVAAAQLHLQQQLATAMAGQLQGQSAATHSPNFPQVYMTSRGGSIASATASSTSQESLSPEHSVLETPPPSAVANQHLQINPAMTALSHQHFQQQQPNGDSAAITAGSNPLLLVNGLNSQVCYQSAKLQ